MAIITPVAWRSSSSPQIFGTTQVGNLSVGTTPQDYGVVGANNGVVFYSTPDQEVGYVIAHEDPLSSHNGLPGNVPAKVGFWRTAKTENAFLEFVNGMFNQSFTGGTDAVTYLNNNGYWTSFTPKNPYSELENIAAYLRGYMPEFRNPSFYAYQLDGNGYYINDGGGDMYDQGNVSSPWIIANTEYVSPSGYNVFTYPYAVNYENSGSTSMLDTSFGYISLGYQQYPPGGPQPLTYLPLTVLGSRDNDTYGNGLPVGFQTGGNSGADGGGLLASGNIYTGQTLSGFSVYAFFRETYNAGDPSHCDLYILMGHPNWNSTFGTVQTFAQPTNLGGCGGYLYTTGVGTKNILAIKTLLSKNGGQIVTQSECQTVVDNFIVRIKESQGF